ncbi:porin family protein [Flavobacterium urumqiense]|uniref:Outer membrane protein beta-barrel domain-containing protein n=1 Tax=Flavobacterium urumqiense TaxID=935224 RepID=A0A1H5ZZ07_9FLAO|nr:porin family protein [Flavobacterium urumqiense]SEG41025.1 Outer membrane protein beta-barrel domain-containing protein [Flavobacterium urumqiense]
MKKITLLLVTVFTVGFVNAQDKEDMSFGVKGGLNVSSITNANQDGVNSKSLIGFHVGFFAEFMISDKFAIQPELLYSAQGVKLESGGDNGDLKLDYINIPVMAKYYVANTFSLEFGPQIGFLVSAKAKSGGVSEDIKDEIQSTDVSLGFGASYYFAERFMFGARYNLGLSRIQKDLFPGEAECKNSVFQISVGYKF